MLFNILIGIIGLVVAVALVLISKDLLCYLRYNKLYKSQGLKFWYKPYAGWLDLLNPEPGKNDDDFRFKRFFNNHLNEDAVVANNPKNHTPFIFLIKPEIVREFYLKEFEICKKDNFEGFGLFHDSFVYEESVHALPKKKMFGELLSIKNMLNKTPIIEKIVQDACKQIKEEHFKNTSEFKQITMDAYCVEIFTKIITVILFPFIDVKIMKDLLEKVEESTLLSIITLMNPLFLFTEGLADKLRLIPSGNERRKLDKELVSRIMKIYKERSLVSDKELGPNVIDLIIKSNRREAKVGKQGLIFTPKQIAGTCMAFLLLANDPAKSAALAGLFILSDLPKERERMYNVVMKEVFGKNKEGKATSDYENSKYMENFVLEILRLRSPGSRSFARKMIKSSKIGGLKLYKGDIVVIPLIGFHTNEKYFKNPEEFIPDRFNSITSSQRNLKYMPFGEGIRRCPGDFFGKTITRIVLANVIKEFEIGRAEDFEPRWVEASLYKLEVCTLKLRPRRI